jgi:hypothetical protein
MKCFWNHDYSKWKVINKGKIQSSCFNYDTGETKVAGITGDWIEQERVCKKCGFTQIDIQKENL